MSTSFTSVLHDAVALHNLANVVELLQGGADIDEVDEDGQTPLHWACILFNTAVVEALLRHNADIEMVNNDGYTALQCCIFLPDTFPNLPASFPTSSRMDMLQLMAMCAQTRLGASSAEWIRLARNERN